MRGWLYLGRRRLVGPLPGSGAGAGRGPLAVTSWLVIPNEDIARVGDAQTRFDAVIAGLTDDDARRASRLPDWTVGHVLAHVARNADSHVRRAEAATRGEVVEQYPGGWRAFPDRWPTTESEVLAHEVRATVAAAIDSLPIRQQVVLTLRDIDGHAAEDVCALLEISMVNQRVLLHRARATVRGRLERYFTTAGVDS